MCDVNLVTGDVTQYVVDTYLPGLIPFHIVRTYSAAKSRERSQIGYGWQLNLPLKVQLRAGSIEYTTDANQVVKLPIPGVGKSTTDSDSAMTLSRSELELVLRQADDVRLVFQLQGQPDGPLPLRRQEDPFGNAINYDYDQKNLLKGVLDTRGRRLILGYDQLDRLIDVWLADSAEERHHFIRYEYDASEDLVAAISPSGQATRYEYDDHLLTRVTSSVGGEILYQYDKHRRCVRTWKSGGVLYKDLRFDQRLPCTLVVNSLGHQTLYINNRQGLTVAEVDPLGRRRADVIDDYGKVLLNTSRTGAIQEVVRQGASPNELIVDRNGAETTFELDANRRPVKITNPESAASEFEYGPGDNVIRVVRPLGGVWRFTYDSQGELSTALDPTGYQLWTERPNQETVILRDRRGLLLRTHYDHLGSADEYRDPLGRALRIRADTASNSTSVAYPDDTRARWQLDGEGRVVRQVDELGRVTEFEYDVTDCRYSVTRPDGSRESLEFDTEQQLRKITNFKGEQARFRYDAAGRPVRIEYFDGRAETIEYDDDDNPVAVRDGAGKLIAQLEYDGARLVRERLPDGTAVSITYGNLCQIKELTNDWATLAFEWDEEARVVEERVNQLSLSFQFDSRGSRTSLVANTSRRIDYQWDDRARLTSMVDSTRWKYEYEFDERDLVVTCRLPSGASQHFEYDEINRMTRRSAIYPDGAVICERRYQYDAAGRIVQFDDLQRGTIRYLYDINDYLREVMVNGTTTEAYDYDANGNLLKVRTGEAVTIAPGDRAAKCGSTEYQFNRLGQLSRRIGAGRDLSCEYAGEGWLRRVRDSRGRTYEFECDPLGRRLAKTQDGLRTEFMWDGVALLAETTSGRTTDYLFMPGSFFLAGMTIGEEHYSFVFDQLGCPTEVLDGRGRIVWQADYTAWGEITTQRASGIRNPFRSLGQYCDDGLGIYYNRHRYYDPLLGRFTTPDPIGFNGGSNLYAFGPNPTNWVDPWGLFTCTIRPKCNWSNSQQQDMKKKEKAVNAKIKAGVGPVPKPCDARKNAKEIYDKCRKNGSPMPKLSETASKCSNQQADHILEVCAGGGEADCGNLQPLNESVNKSFGSQMGNCVAGRVGQVITAVKVLDMSQCKPGGRKCP